MGTDILYTYSALELPFTTRASPSLSQGILHNYLMHYFASQIIAFQLYVQFCSEASVPELLFHLPPVFT